MYEKDGEYKEHGGKLHGKGGHGFLQGALILTAGMAIVKVIGALFKIPLKYAIGEYGMGLFNVAYHFFGPIFSLATAGFPVAIARMVSENGSTGRWNDVRQIKKVSLPLFFFVGLFGMVLMTVMAPLYCDVAMGSRAALAPMLALAPAVLFASLGSVYRGYYEGLKDMYPTAASEVVEALLKLVLGLSGAAGTVALCTAEYARSQTVFSLAVATAEEGMFVTLSFAAAAAVLGVTLGSLCSFLYLWIRFRRKGDGITLRMCQRAPVARSKRKTVKRLLRIAVPVAIGSVAMNVAGLIDATFLQSRLADVVQEAPNILFNVYPGMISPLYGEHPEALPTFLYGCYTLAMTLYLLVPAVTQAFAVSALPNVTEAWAKGDRKELSGRMASVLKITALFCFPAGLGLSALAEPICRVLYGGDSATGIVAQALFLLGFGAVMTAMSTPLSSMLQAVGREDIPVKLLLVAMGIKLGINYVLCGIPEINLMGAAVGTFFCYVFLVGAQIFFLRKVTHVRFSLLRLFVRPMACACICAMAAWASHEGIMRVLPDGKIWEAVCLGVSIGVGAVFYVISLMILRGIGKKEILLLPKGQKIAKTLEKRGWI